MPLRMLNVCGALILGTEFSFHSAGRWKWVESLSPGKEQATRGHVLKDWEGWHRQMVLPVPSVVWLRGWPAWERWDLGVKGKLDSCAVPAEQAVLSRHQRNNWEKWFPPMFSVIKKSDFNVIATCTFLCCGVVLLLFWIVYVKGVSTLIFSAYGL